MINNKGIKLLSREIYDIPHRGSFYLIIYRFAYVGYRETFVKIPIMKTKVN